MSGTGRRLTVAEAVELAKTASEEAERRHREVVESDAERNAPYENHALDVVRALLPIVQYVSRGRGYVGVESYPDAAARRALDLAYELLDVEVNESSLRE